MVDEAILGALKSALSRGESLKKAMMTLYNAGYKKEKISEAARSLNETNLAQAQQIQQGKTTQPQQPVSAQMLAPSGQLTPQGQPLQQPQQPMQQQPQTSQVSQRVSGYGPPPKPEGKTVIIILGFLLLLLVGIVVTIFLFKEELMDFFNNMFS